MFKWNMLEGRAVTRPIEGTAEFLPLPEACAVLAELWPVHTHLYSFIRLVCILVFWII